MDAARLGSPWQIDVGDIRLSGHVRRAADERAVLVLSHGFGEHSGRYGAQIGFLADRGVSVVSYDLRGHGASPGPRARVAAARHVRDQLEVRHAVRERWRDDAPGAELPPMLLMGHSMGGLIAAESALRDPFGLAGVVLSSPALVVGDDKPEAIRRLGPVLARLIPRAPVDRIDPATVSRRPEVVAEYVADPLVHHGAVPALTAGTMLGAGRQTLGRCRLVRVPTLLVHGTDDRLTSIAGSRRFAAEAGSAHTPRPEITLREFPGGYHELFNDECAAEAYAALGKWLDTRLG